MELYINMIYARIDVSLSMAVSLPINGLNADADEAWACVHR